MTLCFREASTSHDRNQGGCEVVRMCQGRSPHRGVVECGGDSSRGKSPKLQLLFARRRNQLNRCEQVGDDQPDWSAIRRHGKTAGTGRGAGSRCARLGSSRRSLERSVVSATDPQLPEARAGKRGRESGLLNSTALMTTIQKTRSSAVRDSISAGQFPLVYGADCSVRPAAVPALQDTGG